MNSRVWSVDGIDPSVRERIEAAARRAGMTVNDWLNASLGETSPPNFRGPAEPRPSLSRDVADIHQWLDSITRQIDQISQTPRRNDPSREQGVAHQLNDAISRLDARLAQISTPQAPRQPQAYRDPAYRDLADHDRHDAVERAAAQVYHNQAYRNSPPLSPASFDSAIAEIAARQNELDAPPRAMPPRAAPPIAPQASPIPPQPSPIPPQALREPSGPDFSSLERHLIKITSQIEALQRPSGVEQSIAAFRSELAEIRNAIMEAMPRRAIESIESEIRSLSRRIDNNRQNTVDDQALANIERALSEIREVLRSLMPAEQLRGYDEAIRNLGAKLDMILRVSDDPGTVQQLESAIAALRGIVSNVASTDALARLAEDVRLLSTKVDQITQAGGHRDSLAAIEQRIAALTAALESRERPVFDERSARLEEALGALSDRIDRVQVGNDSAATFAHLEQRVSYLLERIEASNDQRGGANLSRVEDALHDILGHLERQHAAFVRLADSTQRPSEPQDPRLQDSELVDLVRRELSDIRFSQSETNRHTQDSLETVNTSLGHVVDRLAVIEGDLRTARAAPPPPVVAPAPADPAPSRAMPQQPKPELPNPAAAQAHFVAAPRNLHAAEPVAAPAAPVPPVPPAAISEILAPHAQAQPRPAIAPELPPDHPLEPGTRPNGRPASPSERIAASENAISDIPPARKPPVSSSSFIAAARRAAQAAAAAQANPAEKGGASPKDAGTDNAKKEPSGVTAKIRSVLVAASVVVIVLGTFKMAMSLLDVATAPQEARVESADEPTSPAPAPAEKAVKPAQPEQLTPRMTSPTPIDRQSFDSTAPAAPTASVEIPQPAAPTISDITGAIPTLSSPGGSRRLSAIAIPPSEKLPDAIGSAALRAAALKGDPTAAYEVAVRFAEGRGVATSYEDAARWYDRAAQAGVIPATFRLGTLYEKGLGVTKDADTARRYYVQAAERGNAKAMHNLAVLDADGGGKGPNYASAAQWFRKAADHGVADSQFNLGILYARGIGVEQNLAESYKWFTLAAAQGDADAGRKRDDVAKRLDAQSLAAARLAIQTFIAEPQPDDAVNVPAPPGGWDSSSPATKPAARPAASKRAAAALPAAAH
jgi:localization factor PodJL